MAAMAMVFASCSEMDFEDGFGGVTRNVKLNVTVADLGTDEPATRAKIKSDWAKDDQIEIYLDDNTDKAFMLTYDGSKWTGPETISGTPSASGHVKALYNGQVIVASKDNYSYDSNSKTLTFSINNWKFLTQIQVVVEGITGDASGYTLACDKFTPLNETSKYTVGTDAITASTGTKGAAATGFESATNSGAAAFVFATADYTTGESTDNYAFTLIRTSSIKEKVSFSVNKAFASTEGNTTIKAIKLAYNKFEHEGVQLWANGPKWATCNVGATSPEDYGDYFAWGEVAPYYTNGGWSTSTTWGGTSTKKNGYNWQNYCGNSSYNEWSTKPYDETSNVLKSTYDAATANWGDGWRMPTQAEFSNLINKCKWIWTTQGGKNGYKVTGKKEGYTDKSIFLPATGYRSYTSLDNAGSYGYFWSSSLSTSLPNYAYYLYFYSGYPNTNDDYRYYGFTVRPVSK